MSIYLSETQQKIVQYDEGALLVIAGLLNITLLLNVARSLSVAGLLSIAGRAIF
jgi:hypothetical protein